MSKLAGYSAVQIKAMLRIQRRTVTQRIIQVKAQMRGLTAELDDLESQLKDIEASESYMESMVG